VECHLSSWQVAGAESELAGGKSELSFCVGDFDSLQLRATTDGLASSQVLPAMWTFFFGLLSAASSDDKGVLIRVKVVQGLE
jgi:hypothetical protein